MDIEASQELAEAIGLLEVAKGPRVREALSALVASLKEGQAAPANAPVEAAPSGSSNGTTSAAAMSGSQLPAAEEAKAPPAPAPGSGSQAKVEGGVPAAPRAPEKRYAMVEKFAWDQGEYNSPKVSVYVPLEGVGAAKERVACSFTTRGFDLTVEDLNGKSYRLVQNNLDKDIVVKESKFLVKKDKVIVKLQKVKGEYGSYDHWSNLAAKKTKRADTKADPQAGLMDMMKDMYDDGDDNTKKLIGEAMMKSQQNRGKPDAYGSDSGLGGGSKFSPSAAGLGGLGGGLGGMGGAGKGLDSPAANFDSMMDDMDLDKEMADGGWGAGGKDDFGFGSAVPPPQASSDPVPAATEAAEDKQGEEDEKAGLSSSAEPPAAAAEAPNSLEDLDP